MTEQDLLKDALRNRKQRMTAQRELILRVFMDSHNKLMSVEDVFMEIKKKRQHRTSKMTVKRAIDLLVELGLLKEVRFNQDTIKYEYVTQETEEETVLFLCERCGKAHNIPIDEKFLKDYFSSKGVAVRSMNLKITGHCEECIEEFSKIKV